MGRSARNKMALSATEDVLLDPFLVEQIMLMMKTECEPGCLTALADELAHFLTRSTAVCLTWHKTVTICKTKCVNRRTKQITTVCVNNLKQACPHYCDRCSTVDQPKKDAQQLQKLQKWTATLPSVSGRPTAGQLRCGPLSIAMARHFQLVVEREEWKLDTLCDLYEHLMPDYRTISDRKMIVFCHSCAKVDWLKNQIAARRFADVVAMHGTHTPKQLFELKSRNDLFIATDRLVNGSHHIHDPSAIVVCYDMPAPAHYLRLVGMAGSYGRPLTAITFTTHMDGEAVEALEQYYGICINTMPVDILHII